MALGDRPLSMAGDTHPDWLAAHGRIASWSIVAASAVGQMHLRDHTPRDDAFSVRAIGPWLAVAVADGAGSKRRSRYGAAFAVDMLTEQLLCAVTGAEPADTPIAPEPDPDGPASSSVLGLCTDSVQSMVVGFDEIAVREPRIEASACWASAAWRRVEAPMQPEADGAAAPSLSEAVRMAFGSTRLQLESYVSRLGVSLRDIHCTLMCVLLDTRTGAFAAGHIGDGLVAALHPGFGARPAVEPPSTGNVGETYVITQEGWDRYLAVTELSQAEAEGISTLYLMTDGVADDCSHPPPPGVFDRWARDIDREVRASSGAGTSSVRLVRWLANYELPGSWDDRTLVVLTKACEQK